MKRATLDTATAAVKKFLRTLPREPVELELEGEVVCTVIPPPGSSDTKPAALIQRGRELVHRSRQRNKGVSAEQLKREVRPAAD